MAVDVKESNVELQNVEKTVASPKQTIELQKQSFAKTTNSVDVRLKWNIGSKTVLKKDDTQWVQLNWEVTTEKVVLLVLHRRTIRKQLRQRNSLPHDPFLETCSGNFFQDGVRRVDFVLTYELENPKYQESRITFENNLQEHGVELEYDFLEKGEDSETSSFVICNERPDGSDEFDGKSGVVFVKVHAPWEVLSKWAEISRMRKPIAVNNVFSTGGRANRFAKWFTAFTLNSSKLTKQGYMFETHESDQSYFTAPFDRQRISTFLIENKDTFFTTAERFRLMDSILTVTRFGDEEKVGIQKLEACKAYYAYPPHAGDWVLPKRKNGSDEKTLLNARQTLYWTWSRPGVWMLFQPLELIRLYFGEKIAVYFAWLGFYTQMLIPAALFGVVAFIYGVATLHSDEVQQQTCNSDAIICPLCEVCDFVPFNNSCLYSKISYVFDNSFTVAFAFLMALWATFFLEFWKRRKEQLAYKWDTNDISQEEGLIRPEYEMIADKSDLNPVTGKQEPFLSTAKRARRLAVSCTTLLFMLCLVLAALFGVITYRIIVSELAYRFSPDGFFRSNSRVIISLTASVINFIIITIMDILYQKLAIKLTNIEGPRTQDEFEDSYTLKMFLFQAVNYYSSTCYAAFFRGRFVGTPKAYTRLGGYRQEQCDPAGCFIEVFINVAIVMVLKQALNNAKELLFPLILNKWNQRKVGKADDYTVEDEEGGTTSNAECEISEKFIKEATIRDYSLESFGELGLFSEYLEMVIQYGFVTLFAAAFPLGPLFALLNNVVEIRLDAYKFVTQVERVVPERSKDIGMWFSILEAISIIAVLSNGLIIGITSKFIEKTVFLLLYSPCNTDPNYAGGCLDGFVRSTLISIPVGKIERKEPYNTSLPGVPSSCWYQTSDPTEALTGEVNHWHLYAGIFIFLFVFQNVTFGLKILVDILVPDIPGDLLIQSRRQRLLETRMFYEHAHDEGEKSKKKAQPLLHEHDEILLDNDKEQVGGSETDVV